MNEEMLNHIYNQLFKDKVDYDTFKKDMSSNIDAVNATYDKLGLAQKGVLKTKYYSDLGLTPNREKGSLNDYMFQLESKALGGYKAYNGRGGGQGAVGGYQHRYDTHKDEIAKITGVTNRDEFYNNPFAQEQFQNHLVETQYKPHLPVLRQIAKNKGLNYNDTELMYIEHHEGFGGAKTFLLSGNSQSGSENILAQQIKNGKEYFKATGSTDETIQQSIGNIKPKQQVLKTLDQKVEKIYKDKNKQASLYMWAADTKEGVRKKVYDEAFANGDLNPNDFTEQEFNELYGEKDYTSNRKKLADKSKERLNKQLKDEGLFESIGDAFARYNPILTPKGTLDTKNGTINIALGTPIVGKPSPVLYATPDEIMKLKFHPMGGNDPNSRENLHLRNIQSIISESDRLNKLADSNGLEHKLKATVDYKDNLKNKIINKGYKSQFKEFESLLQSQDQSEENKQKLQGLYQELSAVPEFEQYYKSVEELGKMKSQFDAIDNKYVRAKAFESLENSRHIDNDKYRRSLSGAAAILKTFEDVIITTGKKAINMPTDVLKFAGNLIEGAAQGKLGTNITDRLITEAESDIQAIKSSKEQDGVLTNKVRFERNGKVFYGKLNDKNQVEDIYDDEGYKVNFSTVATKQKALNLAQNQYDKYGSETDFNWTALGSGVKDTAPDLINMVLVGGIIKSGTSALASGSTRLSRLGKLATNPRILEASTVIPTFAAQTARSNIKEGKLATPGEIAISTSKDLALEMVAESLFAGPIGKLMGDKVTKETLLTLTKNKTKDLIDNLITGKLSKVQFAKEFGKAVKELGVDMLGEGVEESFTDIAKPLTDDLLNGLLDTSFDTELPTIEELGSTFLVGAAAGGLMGGVNFVGNTANIKTNVQDYYKNLLQSSIKNVNNGKIATTSVENPLLFSQYVDQLVTDGEYSKENGDVLKSSMENAHNDSKHLFVEKPEVELSDDVKSLYTTSSFNSNYFEAIANRKKLIDENQTAISDSKAEEYSQLAKFNANIKSELDVNIDNKLNSPVTPTHILNKIGLKLSDEELKTLSDKHKSIAKELSTSKGTDKQKSALLSNKLLQGIKEIVDNRETKKASDPVISNDLKQKEEEIKTDIKSDTKNSDEKVDERVENPEQFDEQDEIKKELLLNLQEDLNRAENDDDYDIIRSEPLYKGKEYQDIINKHQQNKKLDDGLKPPVVPPITIDSPTIDAQTVDTIPSPQDFEQLPNQDFDPAVINELKNSEDLSGYTQEELQQLDAERKQILKEMEDVPLPEYDASTSEEVKAQRKKEAEEREILRKQQLEVFNEREANRVAAPNTEVLTSSKDNNIMGITPGYITNQQYKLQFVYKDGTTATIDIDREIVEKAGEKSLVNYTYITSLSKSNKEIDYYHIISNGSEKNLKSAEAEVVISKLEPGFTVYYEVDINDDFNLKAGSENTLTANNFVIDVVVYVDNNNNPVAKSQSTKKVYIAKIPANNNTDLNVKTLRDNAWETFQDLLAKDNASDIIEIGFTTVDKTHSIPNVKYGASTNLNTRRDVLPSEVNNPDLYIIGLNHNEQAQPVVESNGRTRLANAIMINADGSSIPNFPVPISWLGGLIAKVGNKFIKFDTKKVKEVPELSKKLRELLSKIEDTVENNKEFNPYQEYKEYWTSIIGLNPKDTSAAIFRYRSNISNIDAEDKQGKIVNPRGGIAPLIFYTKGKGFTIDDGALTKEYLSLGQVYDILIENKIHIDAKKLTKDNFNSREAAQYRKEIQEYLSTNYKEPTPTQTYFINNTVLLNTNTSFNTSKTPEVVTPEVKKVEPVKRKTRFKTTSKKTTEPLRNPTLNDNLTWFRERFKEVGIKVDDEALKVIANIHNVGDRKLWGAFQNAMVILSSDANLNVTKHEAFHVVFNLFLNDNQRSQILDEAFEKFGKELGISKEDYEKAWLNKNNTDRFSLDTPISQERSKDISDLFNENPELANAVYEALGFETNITQDNKSYYRGQTERPTIDKDGNLVLYAREDELYKRAGLESKGVSMTDELQSAVEYGNGQLEVAQNLASETYDAERELERLSENGYYLIQIPKNISNEIVKEAGEVKVIGDKIVIPKGQYKIEQVIDGVDTKITPQQKQQALQLYSQYLDTIFPDSKVKDIVYRGKTENQTNKKSKELGIFFTDDKNAANIYAVKYKGDEFDDSIIQGIVNKYGLNPTIEQIKTEIAFFEKIGASKEQIEKDAKEFQEYILNNKGASEQAILNIKIPKNLTVKDWFDNYENSSKLKENSDGLLLKGGKQSDNRIYDAGENQIVVFEPEQIHILGGKQDIEGFREFVKKPNNVLFKLADNEVNYVLKAVDLLQSEEGKKIFDKGIKNNWSLDKILTELQIPKQQIQLILDSNLTDREEIITDLLANYSYTVEINTAKGAPIREGLAGVNNGYDHGSRFSDFEYNGSKYTTGSELEFDGEYHIFYRKDGKNIRRSEFEDAAKNLQGKQEAPNTQYYSNLTVPGGTNYTENEIATPAITPSIKGHAQFATNKGIGWFRSDDKVKDGTQPTLSKEEALQRSLNDDNFLPFDTDNTGGIPTKTRRILEVQDDWLQKLKLNFRINGINYSKGTLSERNGYYYLQYYKLNKKERKQDSDSKNLTKEEYDRFKEKSKNDIIWLKGEVGNETAISTSEYFKAYDEFIDKGDILAEGYTEQQRQFAKLLANEEYGWNFRIKAIIQDSAKKGYEKVVFPSGNTASKVEGHSTLEEFKKAKEDRIKRLEEDKLKAEKILNINDKKDLYLEFDGEEGLDRKQFNTIEELIAFSDSNSGWYNEKIGTSDFGQFRVKSTTSIQNEITQLKQELERAEIEGFGALKPIYNFYETTVTNILNKVYGKENVKQITDEYGNTWNEITIKPIRDTYAIRLKTEQDSYYQSQGPLIQLEEKLAELFEEYKEDLGLFSSKYKTKYPKITKFIEDLYKFMFNNYQILRSYFTDRVTIESLFYQLDNNIYGRDFLGNRKKSVQQLFNRNLNNFDSIRNKISNWTSENTERYASFINKDLMDTYLRKIYAERYPDKPLITPSINQLVNKDNPLGILLKNYYDNIEQNLIDYINDLNEEGVELDENLLRDINYQFKTSKNFKKLTLYSLLKDRGISIQTTEEDFDLDEETGEVEIFNDQAEGWMKNVFKQNPTESLSGEVKEFLARIVKLDNDGNPQYDTDTGQYQYYSLKETHAKLLNNISDSTNIETFVNRFNELIQEFSWAKEIIKQIYGPELIEQRLENNLLLSIEDFMYNDEGIIPIDKFSKGSILRSIYSTIGDLRNVDYRTLQKEKSGSFIMLQANRQNIIENKENTAKNYFKKTYFIDDNSKLQSTFNINKIKDTLNSENITNNDLKNILGSIGFFTSDQTIISILNNKKDLKLTKDLILGYIANVETELSKKHNDLTRVLTQEVRDAKVIFKGNDGKSNTTKNPFKGISAIIVKHDMTEEIRSIYTVKKEKRYNHVYNNYFSREMEMLNQDSKKWANERMNFDGTPVLFHSKLDWYKTLGKTKDFFYYIGTTDKTAPSADGIEYGDMFISDIQATNFNIWISSKGYKNKDSRYYSMPVFSDATNKAYIEDSTMNVNDNRGLESFKEAYLTLALAEFDRINYLRTNKEIDPSFKSGYNYLDKNGFNFFMLPYLNDLGYDLSDPSIRNKMIIEVDGETKFNPIVEKEIGDAIINYLNNEFDIYIDRMIKTGLLEKITNKDSSVKYIVPKNSKLSKNADIESLKNYFFNQSYYYNVYAAVFGGDVAHYKSMVEQQKRNKQVDAPNQGGLWERSHNKVLLLKDVEVPTPTTIVEKLINDLEISPIIVDELRKNLSGNNITDAGTFHTLKRRKEYMKAFDMYKPEIHDSIFEKLDKGAKLNDKEYYEVFGPLKPFYYGLINEKDELGVTSHLVPVQGKNAEILLLPSLAYLTNDNKVKKPNNKTDFNNYQYPDLAKILYIMESNDIGTTMFESAFKASAFKFNEFDNLDHNNILTDDLIVSLPNKFWGTQQVVPEKSEEAAARIGSQIRKIITGDLDPNISLNIDITEEELTEGIKNLSDAEKIMFDGLFKTLLSNKVNSTSIKDIYELLLHLDITDKLKKIEKEHNSKDSLIQYLETKTLEDSPSLQTLESFEVQPDGYTLVPLEVASKKNEKLLNSTYKKVVALKRLGAALVNSSSFGFINRTNTEEDQLQIKYKYDSDGKIIGIDHIEAAVPANYGFLSEYADEHGNIDIEKVPEDLRYGIFYRIPTEGKYSIFPIKITKILPKSSGGQVILPREATTIAGLDFDVDKLYGFFKYPDRNKDVVNESIKLIRDEFAKYDLEYSEDDYKDMLDDILSNNMEVLLASPAAPIIKEILPKLTAINNSKKELITKALKSGIANSEQRHNMMIDLMFGITQSKEFAKDFFNIGSKKQLETALERLTKKYNLESDSNIKSITDLNTQEKVSASNIVGKRLIGIFANSNAFHNLIQKNNIQLTGPAIEVFGKTYTSLNDLVDTAGQKVSKNLSILLFASTEDTKNPVLAPLNINMYTASLATTLLRYGVSLADTLEVLSSPTVKTITDIASNNSLNDLQAGLKKYVSDNPNLKEWEEKFDIVQFAEKYSNDVINHGLTEDQVAAVLEIKNLSTILNTSRDLLLLDLATKSDTGNVGPDISDVIAQLERIFSVQKKIIDKDFLIEGAETLLPRLSKNIEKQEYKISRYGNILQINSFVKILIAELNNLKNVFYHLNPRFDIIRKQISEYRNEKSLKSEHISYVNNEIYNAIIQKDLNKYGVNYHDFMINFPEEFLESDILNKEKYSSIKELFIVNYEQEIPVIELVQNISFTESSTIRSLFDDMILGGDKEEVKLATNLMLYSILTSLNYKKNTFMSVIPPSFYKTKIGNFVRGILNGSTNPLNNYTTAEMNALADLIFKSNFSKFVPRLTDDDYILKQQGDQFNLIAKNNANFNGWSPSKYIYVRREVDGVNKSFLYRLIDSPRNKVAYELIPTPFNTLFIKDYTNKTITIDGKTLSASVLFEEKAKTNKENLRKKREQIQTENDAFAHLTINDDPLLKRGNISPKSGNELFDSLPSMENIPEFNKEAIEPPIEYNEKDICKPGDVDFKNDIKTGESI
jgi:hypothetical protein